MSKECWLVYNGKKSIKVDRERISKSCTYFDRLLNGAFKEAHQHTIHINLGDMFSYEAFRCVIKLADEDIFIRDPNEWATHIEAIQLAIFWGFMEFVEIAEDHLMRQMSVPILVDLSALSRKYRTNLPNLYRVCEEFSKSMDERALRTWPRCCYKDHPKHHYLNCPGPSKDKDWNESPSSSWN